MRRQLLITGVGGLLGTALADIFESQVIYNQVTLHFHSPPHPDISGPVFVGDLGDENHIKELSHQINPEVIINSAALADVDECERNPDASEKINLKAVQYLLRMFPQARFVQISTDYVFPDRGRPPRPQDLADPSNIYGKHKLAAEEAVLNASGGNLVIRTNTMIDYTKRRNFFNFVYHELKSGKEIKCLTDQSSNPITALDAADLVMQLLNKKATGIYHIGGAEFITRYELALRLADFFGLNQSLILSSSMKEIVRPAKRPAVAGLNCHETEKLLGFPMPSLDEGLSRMRKKRQF